MKITYKYDRLHPQLQDCPAGTNRHTGLIVINPDLYNQLTAFQQKFTIQHELGHINLQTDDEIEADGYAFDQLAGTEFMSLKQCVEFLEQVLIVHPENEKRIEALYQRALKWDKNHLTNGFFEISIFGIPLYKLGDKSADARKDAQVAQANENEDAINAGILAATKDDTGKNTPMIVLLLAGMAVAYLLISN
jgi:Zn-dependent peptidase ImmA (M78 family)